MQQIDNTVELVRFTTPDNFNLVGWLTESADTTDDTTAVIHIHGMSGNGFENGLVDALRVAHNQTGRAFFSFNNRGAGVVTWQHRVDNTEVLGGACYERFNESVHDIQGAIDAVAGRGYTKFVLQGHSLGCAKAVHYINTVHNLRVIALILLAPTDMYGWAHRRPGSSELEERAIALVGNENGNAIVSENCWDGGPLSANTHLDYSTKYSAADIYNNRGFAKLAIPTHIVYGTNDVGILEIDGSLAAWRARTEPLLSSSTRISVIDGANHGFVDHLAQLSNVVQ